MDIKYLFHDNIFGDDPYAPTEEELLMKGNRGTLFAVLFRAGGNEKHPSVLLLHGYPGNEQNLDIAQALRRVGFNVLTMHYSGSWGCDGKFSFANVLDDAKTGLAFLQDEENQKLYNIDPDNIFVVGHSMGGFATLHTTADCSGIKGAIALAPFDFGREYMLAQTDDSEKEVMEGPIAFGAEWLNTTWQELYKELKDHQKEFEIKYKAEQIADTPLLIIGGSNDNVAKVSVNGKYLADKIAAVGKGKTDYMELPSTHCFPDMRITLTEEIAKKLISWVEA